MTSVPVSTVFFCAVCLRLGRSRPEFPERAVTMISGMTVCREHIKDVPSSTLDRAVEVIRNRKLMMKKHPAEGATA